MDQIAPDISMRSLQERPARFGGANMIRNVLIVAIAYYIGAELAFLIGTLSDKIFAPFWPPNIVLFCALLLAPPRQWWIYIAAAFPAHTMAELGVGMPMPQLIVAFATNCLVAIANAFAVRRLMVEPPWFGTIRKTIIYVLITAFLSPAFCALGGAFVQVFGGGSLDDYGLYLGALVRFQCARQPDARADRHDLHGAHNAAPPRTDRTRRRGCHYRGISGCRLHHCV